MNENPFYVKIEYVKHPNFHHYLVKFYFNTDLRYEEKFVHNQFGSLEMMTKINNWVQNI